MPRRTLTEELVAKVQRLLPPSKNVCFFDTEIKGFLLELRPSGTGTYYFRYRAPDGNVRLSLLGRLGKISLAEARESAYEQQRIAAEGKDPKLELAARAHVPTLEEFVTERFLPRLRATKRSWSNDAANLRLHILPTFGSQRLHQITREAVADWLLALKDSGYAANSCNKHAVLLRHLFNVASRSAIRLPYGNPCHGLKLVEDAARERYLSRDELARLRAALDSSPHQQVANVVRLLLLTGARKREILDLAWTELDLPNRMLVVPASRSKSRKARHIPLSDAALSVIESIPREDEMPWVFWNPATRRPPVSIFYAWDTIRRNAGLADMRLHDLRHSYASFLVGSGVSLYEVQKLLGHHNPKVTMRYAHLADSALVAAANLVGAIMDGAVPANAEEEPKAA